LKNISKRYSESVFALTDVVCFATITYCP